jgi:hypothetical protein
MAIAVILIVYVPERRLEKFEWKWFRFSLVSALLVCFSLKAYWNLRKSAVFWGIFAGFLLVHCLGFGYFYYVGRGLNTLEVALLSGLEWGFMATIIYKALHAAPELRLDEGGSRWTPTL